MTVSLFLNFFATFFVSSLLIGMIGLILVDYGYNLGDLFMGLSAFSIKLSIVIFLGLSIYAIWVAR